MATAVCLVLLGYLLWVSRSGHGYAGPRLKSCATWQRSSQAFAASLGNSSFLQNIALLVCFFLLSVSLPGSTKRSLQRSLQRSSHPTAMMPPLFLVGLLKRVPLPAAFVCPSTGFTPGFPLRRALYCCQTILAVYAAGDSLSLWNELFYCCQLVREMGLKAEPERGPGSDRFKVEASRH